MPTENRRIATYLPKHIDERLEAFKSGRSIKGDSQALIIILSEFLEVNQEVVHQSGSVTLELKKRVEGLEERIAQLKDELLSELRKELLEHRNNSIEQAKAEVRDELLSELNSELPKFETLPGQLELLSESDGELTNEDDQAASAAEIAETFNTQPILTTGELANRLKIDASTVSHWKPTGRRPKSPEALLKTTREKDPDGVGWIYLPDSKRFCPERDIPSELLSESDSVIPDF